MIKNDWVTTGRGNCVIHELNPKEGMVSYSWFKQPILIQALNDNLSSQSAEVSILYRC